MCRAFRFRDVHGEIAGLVKDIPIASAMDQPAIRAYRTPQAEGPPRFPKHMAGTHFARPWRIFSCNLFRYAHDTRSTCSVLLLPAPANAQRPRPSPCSRAKGSPGHNEPFRRRFQSRSARDERSRLVGDRAKRIVAPVRSGEPQCAVRHLEPGPLPANEPLGTQRQSFLAGAGRAGTGNGGRRQRRRQQQLEQRKREQRLGRARPGKATSCLFEDEDYRGNVRNISGAVRDLCALGFNDKASSVIVNRGRWVLCDQGDYKPRVHHLGTRHNIPALPPTGSTT